MSPLARDKQYHALNTPERHTPDPLDPIELRAAPPRWIYERGRHTPHYRELECGHHKSGVRYSWMRDRLPICDLFSFSSRFRNCLLCTVSLQHGFSPLNPHAMPGFPNVEDTTSSFRSSASVHSQLCHPTREANSNRNRLIAWHVSCPVRSGLTRLLADLRKW
jgi:hypothetical protein